MNPVKASTEASKILRGKCGYPLILWPPATSLIKRSPGLPIWLGLPLSLVSPCLPYKGGPFVDQHCRLGRVGCVWGFFTSSEMQPWDQLFGISNRWKETWWSPSPPEWGLKYELGKKLEWYSLAYFLTPCGAKLERNGKRLAWFP